jgi:protein-S-isoprenylcysteine O-methyltransferase Ste14
MSAGDTSTSDLWARWRVRVGFPVALVSYMFARPTPRSMLWGASVAALGLVVRGLAAGYLRKGVAITTAGPYAYTRNPLYLGSALAAAGFLVAAASWISAALVAAYFIAFYPAVMRWEERGLRRVFASAYEDYAARVPRFWPRLTPAKAGGAGPAEGFSWALFRRNREYRAALGYLGVMVLLWLRMNWRS